MNQQTDSIALPADFVNWEREISNTSLSNNIDNRLNNSNGPASKNSTSNIQIFEKTYHLNRQSGSCGSK